MVIESERAAWSIDLLVADLILAVLECKSTDDALKISEQIEPLIYKLEVCQRSALAKADALSGASR